MASSEFDYKKYLALVKENKKLFIIAALLIMTVVTVVSYVLPNKYEASSTVFIEKSVIAEMVKGLAFTPSVEDKIKVLTYALNSRTLIAKVIDELDLKKAGEADQEQLIKKFLGNTQIKVKDKEGLFVISFQDNSPKLARDYVNTLVRKYIEENTASKRNESYGATEFLSEQLSTFKEKLEKAEAAANAYKRGAGSVATMDAPSLLKEINEAQQRADDLKIKQAQLETTLSGLGRANSLQSNLPVLQKRLQELQLQYTDNYPEIIKLKDDIRSLEEQSRSGVGLSRSSDSPEYERVASELKVIRQAEANLRATIARNRALLQSLPSAKATLDDLEREKNAQKSLYDTMVARQGQSEVSKQIEVQDKATVFRIVDPAVLPIKPISPDRVKIILIGILAGIGGGLGLVLLKDQQDTSVKTVEMAKQFGLPILAVIPRIEEMQLQALQAKQDRRLYVVSGLYFSLIVAVLVSEVAGMSVISKVIKGLSG